MKISIYGVLFLSTLISAPLQASDIPNAIWANSDKREALEWSGSESSVLGVTHSNGGIKVGGSENSFTGGFTSVRRLDNGGSDNEYSPPAERVDDALAWPLMHVRADYEPGGRAALAAGANYYDLTSVCEDDDKWDVDVQNTQLASGLYWVPCEVVFSASNLSGEISVVSTHSIKVSGSDQTNLSAFSDGLLFWTDTDEDDGIEFSGSDMTVNGYLSAQFSRIKLSGSDLALTCGVFGDSVEVSGSHIDVMGEDCGAAPNTPPIALDSSVETPEDSIASIALQGSDANDDALSFTVLMSPLNGTLSGVAPNLQYSPNVH